MTSDSAFAGHAKVSVSSQNPFSTAYNNGHAIDYKQLVEINKHANFATYRLFVPDVSTNESERYRDAKPQSKNRYQRTKRDGCGATFAPENQVHNEEDAEHESN